MTFSSPQPSEHFGELQSLVCALFPEDTCEQASLEFAECNATDQGPKVTRLEVVVAAEARDLPEDLLRIVSLLPPGSFTRQQLTDQLNSALSGHALGLVYGIVS